MYNCFRDDLEKTRNKITHARRARVFSTGDGAAKVVPAGAFDAARKWLKEAW